MISVPKWNEPTALLSGTLQQNVGQMHHALHRHMPPYPFHPSGSDEGYPDSGLCDYCISISLHRLAI
jgi:hypothetical protein